jgi:hypothetical protein
LSPGERLFCHREGVGSLAKTCILNKRKELVHGQACLPNDRAQSAAVEFPVIRDCGLGGRSLSNHGDVIATLPINNEAYFAERFDAFSARDDRQLAHAATSTSST